MRSGDRLGESPVWDERAGELIWVDAAAPSALNIYEWDEGRHHRVELEVRCSAVDLTSEPGTYVAALGDSVGLIDRSGAVLRSIRLSGDPDFLTNDGACGPGGSFWFGTTTVSRQPQAGTLLRYDGSAVSRVSPDGYTLANGIAWDPAGDRFFHVDTLDRVIRSYEWDPAQDMAEPVDVWQVPEEYGLADGIELDTDGGLWVAFWGGSAVRRYRPDGTVEQTVAVPVPNVTAVTFAGRDRSTLVITTAGSEVAGSGDVYATATPWRGIERTVFDPDRGQSRGG